MLRGPFILCPQIWDLVTYIPINMNGNVSATLHTCIRFYQFNLYVILFILCENLFGKSFFLANLYINFMEYLDDLQQQQNILFTLSWCCKRLYVIRSLVLYRTWYLKTQNKSNKQSYKTNLWLYSSFFQES